MPSAVLTISRVDLDSGTARVNWRLETTACTRLAPVPFEFSLREGLDLAPPDAVTAKCAAFAFLSIALPLLAFDEISVTVHSPWQWSPADLTYWRGTLNRLGFDATQFRFESTGPALPFRYEQPAPARLSMGLFYGGGVESNAALSGLLPYRPNLLIIEGPSWMNNNTGADVGWKRQLETEVGQKFGLDLLYVHINSKALVPQVSDALLNHYCTGGIFYWAAAAAGLRRGIPLFLVSQELEYSLAGDRFDKSIGPHLLFWTRHEEAPLILPIMGWSAKIDLLGLLRDSPLLEYVYSCHHNSGERWCGRCSKCYRISDWTRRLGIDPARLGMHKPVPGGREGIMFYRLHTQSAEELYPDPEPLPESERIFLTDLFLIDRYHLQSCDCANGQLEIKGNRFTASSTTDAPVEVRFPKLDLRGANEFSGRVESAGGHWHVAFELRDARNEPVAEWSRTLKGATTLDLGQRLPACHGRHTLFYRLRRLSPATGPAPALYLPTLRRRGTA